MKKRNSKLNIWSCEARWIYVSSERMTSSVSSHWAKRCQYLLHLKHFQGVLQTTKAQVMPSNLPKLGLRTEMTAGRQTEQEGNTKQSGAEWILWHRRMRRIVNHHRTFVHAGLEKLCMRCDIKQPEGLFVDYCVWQQIETRSLNTVLVYELTEWRYIRRGTYICGFLMPAVHKNLSPSEPHCSFCVTAEDLRWT